MTDDRTGRELTPRPEDPTSAVAPREGDLPAVPAGGAIGDRFYAGDQAHTVGLTEERAAKIVKQSGNARMIAFLATLFIVLFIPIYWLYDIGLPVIGVPGRLVSEVQNQQVTDISRGYALFLANCARCHDSPGGPPGNGMGNIGPALNDQGKLYNTVTAAGAPGPGHLNPNYVNNVLTVGGRYVCGDPNSIMPVWAQPNGPLNYQQVNDIIAWITASNEVSFTYAPAAAEGAGGATAPPATTVTGWRDPSYTPPPGATPVPACWRGTTTGGSTSPSLAPVSSPGTAANPREIDVTGTDQLKWTDAAGNQITQLAVVPGEVITFKVDVNSSIAHSFHIGAGTDLAVAPEPNDLPGLPQFANGTQTFTYTVPSSVPSGTQFACTVPGHYQAGMHVDLISSGGAPAGSAAPGSGAPESAAPSVAPGGSPPESAIPGESAAPPPPSAAPSAAPS
jgi:mono/diheme cytochrome c family protein